MDGWTITFNEWARQYGACICVVWIDLLVVVAGNMLNAFNIWGQLGDLVYIQLPGMPFFNVNSLDMAHELLSKRIQINSNRKIGYMVRHLMGWSWSPAFMDADAVHRRQRLMFRRGIGPTRIPTYDHLIEKSSRMLVLDLQSLEGDPIKLIFKAVGTAIIELSYGETVVKMHGEDMIKLNAEAMHMLESALQSVWLVDFFPTLRFLPPWLASFRRYADRSTSLVNRIRAWPYKVAQGLFKEGKLGHCLIGDLFEEFGEDGDVRDAVANLYFAGVDTTTSAATSFLLILFLFPEVAKKVQAEIDAVLGQSGLPTVKDRANLPYTEAVWKESLRWHPTVPNAIPHCSTEDQTIDGYFIPKGAIINPNIGECRHIYTLHSALTVITYSIGYMLVDPRIWGDPEVFKPERHLPSHNPNAASLPNPTQLPFGFGARTCPGMHFADRVGFHLVLTLISLFDLLPPIGKDRPIPDTVEYTKSVILYPIDFKLRFVPRNEKAAALLSAMNVAAND
ncbi:hypothetical protein FRC17_010818 [Serendipita sp. 399]|nr:hypothetical protein FRC17_010818 [Serendipita sp. 399]